MDFPAEHLEAVPAGDALAAAALAAVGVTAEATMRGTDLFFVSRFFGAGAGVGEDPVTGSPHSQIAPYWAQRLGRSRLTARQLSQRGGTVTCDVDGDRVRLGGTYRRYLEGTATIPDDMM